MYKILIKKNNKYFLKFIFIGNRECDKKRTQHEQLHALIEPGKTA